LPGHDFIFEECAKLCGGKGIEAARRFIEEQDFGLMKDGAQKAEALNGAGGKQPYLAIECFDEIEAFGERMNAAVEARIGNVIELAKEAQILAAGKPRIEAEVAAGVITEVSAHGGGFACGVMSCEESVAARWQHQRGENAK